jgi:hypothetical protein
MAVVQYLFQLSASRIKEKIKQSNNNDKVIILKPLLKDLLEHNIYKLYIDDELYLVPLWHNELYFDAKDGSEIKTPIPGYDISISKFSSDGSQLLYSTYLGGLGNETPHSLIVNKKNELILFGATSSTDFPTSTFAYDKTFNSGIVISEGKLLILTVTIFLLSICSL